MALTLPEYTVSGSLPSPSLDNALVTIIYGIFGGIFGFFTSVITLALSRSVSFSQLGFKQILSLAIVFGLTHSLVFAALEYHNAIEGMRPEVLDEFAMKMILRTAVIEFVSGSLIGLISISSLSISPNLNIRHPNDSSFLIFILELKDSPSMGRPPCHSASPSQWRAAGCG